MRGKFNLKLLDQTLEIFYSKSMSKSTGPDRVETEIKSIFAKHIVQEDCLLKVRNHLKRLEKKLPQKKLKKLRKFCKNDNSYFECLERFENHDKFFSFKHNFVI